MIRARRFSWRRRPAGGFSAHATHAAKTPARRRHHNTARTFYHAAQASFLAKFGDKLFFSSASLFSFRTSGISS
jgi:hypothetical protein